MVVLGYTSSRRLCCSVRNKSLKMMTKDVRKSWLVAYLGLTGTSKLYVLDVVEGRFFDDKFDVIGTRLRQLLHARTGTPQTFNWLSDHIMVPTGTNARTFPRLSNTFSGVLKDLLWRFSFLVITKKWSEVGVLASEGWWEAWQPSPKVTRSC